MRDGVVVLRLFYTSSEGKRLNVRALHDLLPQGVSIRVESIHRWFPKIGQLAAAVEREMTGKCLSELLQGRRIQTAFGLP